MSSESATPFSGASEETHRLRQEIRRLEEALDEARRHAGEVEQRYRGLIDRLDAIFWEADVESFEFLYVSPRAEPLLGYPMERWLHEPGFWPKILHPEDRGWVVESCLCATREGRDNDFEYRALAADGRVVWLRDMVYVEKDEAGKATLLRGIMLDITAQKQVEQALRESGEAKDRFLAMLAHELRNPLGAVSNALQVMRISRAGDPAWERSFQVIERQVRHQTRLLNDLLEVSRLTRGKAEAHKERLDLRRLVEETVEDNRGGIERAGLSVAVELPSGPVWVEGDSTQLSQVLANFLSNAEKFSAPGGRVEVRMRTEGPRAAVTVADTGIGLEPAMLAQVWEVFSQADSSLERSRGGLGLGLALAKGFVELNGGEVRAESAGLGRGASFTFSLPRIEESAPAPAPEPAASEPARPGALRILVIEDNVDAAETLGDLLRLFGHEVRLAHTGPEGIEAARAARPDVVLCDIGLPGMDGYAVARQLRREPDTAPVRLVALTGYGRDSDRLEAEEAGFDLHLVKPVEPSDLRQLLAEWARGGTPAPHRH
ncbi:MAG TPA: ATP-binding protein [Thermoanaerobaculia bacterium]|nr:ATP-binding protein [Thermoanaerobaculia bacterium]